MLGPDARRHPNNARRPEIWLLPDTRRCSWCGRRAQPPASHPAEPTVSNPAATRPAPEGTLRGILLATTRSTRAGRRRHLDRTGS